MNASRVSKPFSDWNANHAMRSVPVDAPTGSELLDHSVFPFFLSSGEYLTCKTPCLTADLGSQHLADHRTAD